MLPAFSIFRKRSYRIRLNGVSLHCVKNVVGEINLGPTSTLYLLHIEKLLKCETLFIICYIQHSHRCLVGCIDIPRTSVKFCLFVRINHFYVIFPLQNFKAPKCISLIDSTLFSACCGTSLFRCAV